ncbi:MAG: Pseudaminic acid biosynthesis protein PseA,possible Pse5Ac7Ac acetamidino synthase [Bacteriovoracaceae bacterium]|nr:Pseudaminic acid biosynthesis protein PseA,possible Pse5Ac7Ac acetamidino synthase [Bacteriovoracaceae bacterium]
MAFKLCTRCVMPDTKPDLSFDSEGVCSACKAFENRKAVDWVQRKKELTEILERYRSKDGSNWDCVVPVSGGKDSTYQVVKMLQMGMKPLAVTAATCSMSEVGRRNLDNIRKLGVDLLEFGPSLPTRQKINRIALQQVGDVTWPEHVTIFTIPVRVAIQHKIPLIIWGENSQHEYGGPASAQDKNYLDRRWLEEFGGLLGMRVTDLIGLEGLTKRELLPYIYPSDEEVRSVGVTGLFLGYYIPWDGFTNTIVAQNHGWEAWPKVVEGSALDYENLDNLFHGIHDYFKFLKFGFGRATDHVCMQIRRGRLAREDALEIVTKQDGKFPWTYLDQPIEKMLSQIGLSVDEFVKICDRFTNKKIFKKDSKGNLAKDHKLNLQRLDIVEAEVKPLVIPELPLGYPVPEPKNIPS